MCVSNRWILVRTLHHLVFQNINGLQLKIQSWLSACWISPQVGSEKQRQVHSSRATCNSWRKWWMKSFMDVKLEHNRILILVLSCGKNNIMPSLKCWDQMLVALVGTMWISVLLLKRMSSMNGLRLVEYLIIWIINVSLEVYKSMILKCLFIVCRVTLQQRV